MKKSGTSYHYFPSNVPISRPIWERLHLGREQVLLKRSGQTPEIVFIRKVSGSFNHLPERSGRPVPAGLINLFGLQQRIFRHLIDQYATVQQPGALATAAQKAGADFSSPSGLTILKRFAELFPGTDILTGDDPTGYLAGDDRADTRKNALVRELLLLFLAR